MAIFSKKKELEVIPLPAETTTWQDDNATAILEQLKQNFSPSEIAYLIAFKKLKPGGSIGEYGHGSKHIKDTINDHNKKASKQKKG